MELIFLKVMAQTPQATPDPPAITIDKIITSSRFNSPPLLQTTSQSWTSECHHTEQGLAAPTLAILTGKGTYPSGQHPLGTYPHIRKSLSAQNTS